MRVAAPLGPITGMGGSQSGKFKEVFRHGFEDRGHRRSSVYPLPLGMLGFSWQGAAQQLPWAPLRLGSSGKEGAWPPGDAHIYNAECNPCQRHWPSKNKARPKQKRRLWWG